jgi:hypothetical protein
MPEHPSHRRCQGCIAAAVFLGALAPSRADEAAPHVEPLPAGAAVVRLQLPRPVDPWKGILEAFDRQPLVAMSEAHGVVEQAAFIAALIRRPEFPGKVRTIVLEAANAKYQGTIDRYVAGETVSLPELRRVWRDHTCSALGPMDSSNVERFFATVRAVNRKLPAGRRLRVLAGDPPIDWSRVQTREELSRWLAMRDRHYAGIVEREVLNRGQKALLIIGGAHLSREPLPGDDPAAGVMLQILERKHPGKTFVVALHEGLGTQGAAESQMASWPKPSLLLPKGRRPPCPAGRATIFCRELPRHDCRGLSPTPSSMSGGARS